MFCPVCRDEYRRGFTRCATCDVGLVESLDEAQPPRTPAAPAATATIAGAPEPAESTVNFCGFLTLDEARTARDACRAAKLRAEILIKDVPDDAEGGPKEEYWLRILPRDARAAAEIVGFDPGVESPEDAVFTCSACGAQAKASDTACPGCGISFDA